MLYRYFFSPNCVKNFVLLNKVTSSEIELAWEPLKGLYTNHTFRGVFSMMICRLGLQQS
jgi:hypothetical protein